VSCYGTGAHEILILVEGKEDRKFYDWLFYEEKNKSWRRGGIYIQDCGGKNCQKVVIQHRDEKRKIIISDRDYFFITKSDFSTQVEYIRKASKEKRLIEMRGEKDFKEVRLIPTELENLLLLVVLEREPQQLIELIEQNRKKIIALTLLRCLPLVCRHTKERLVKEVKSCKSEEVLKRLFEDNTVSFTQEFRDRLKYFEGILEGISNLEEFLFLIAGKECKEILEKSSGKFIGKILKELNYPPKSKSDSYRRGSSKLLDDFKEEFFKVLEVK